MGKIKIEELVHEKLLLLIDKLHNKKYFGYKHDAVNYVLAIYDFIDMIPERQFYKLSGNSDQYFCRYSPNKNTTYYILFDIDDGDYLITNIFNNHGKEYADFIKLTK